MTDKTHDPNMREPGVHNLGDETTRQLRATEVDAKIQAVPERPPTPEEAERARQAAEQGEPQEAAPPYQSGEHTAPNETNTGLVEALRARPLDEPERSS